MAQSEQSNLSIIHGLDADSKDWEKRVILKLVKGRWTVKIDIAQDHPILTPRDIFKLNRVMVVARRKMEMVHRQRIRKEQREVSQKVMA